MALRLYKLGTWGCWVDELYTLERALGPWGTDVRHPFVWLTRLSLHVFGLNLTALRLLPFLFGSASILGVYTLACVMFDRRTALIAALCLAVSPWYIYLSQFGRAYALVIFVSLWAALCLFRFLESQSAIDLMLFLFLFGFSFFLHHTAAFVLVIGIFVLFATSLLAPLKRTTQGRRMRRVALILAGVSLVFVPSFCDFATHWREKQLASGYWGTTPPVFALKVAYHLTPSLAVAALLGIGQLLRTRRREGIVLLFYALLAPALLALAAAFSVNVSAKYVSFTLPAFAIAASYFIAQVTEKTSRRDVALVGLVALLLLPSLQTNADYFGPGWGNRDRLHEALRFIDEKAAQGDLVVPIYLFKDPVETRFYLRGVARVHGIELDSTRIFVPSAEEDLRSLPRAWAITIGKVMPPEQPHIYRWLATSARLVTEFPARRGAQDNSVRVYLHEGR